MASAVILAAGGSRRMGFPKAMLEYRGKSLLARQCEILHPLVERLVVVSGWASTRLKAHVPPDILHITNHEWYRTGQADSLCLAIKSIPPGRMLVLPVDVPVPSGQLIEAMLSREGSVVPTFRGKHGHPVLLGRDLVETLRHHCPAGGLGNLLGDAQELETGEAWVLANINGPADWARWLLWNRQARPRH